MPSLIGITYEFDGNTVILKNSPLEVLDILTADEIIKSVGALVKLSINKFDQSRKVKFEYIRRNGDYIDAGVVFINHTRVSIVKLRELLPGRIKRREMA